MATALVAVTSLLGASQAFDAKATNAEILFSSHTCSNGIAVSNPQDNTLLVQDCTILLNIRDTLAGDAQLDWNAGTPIQQWEGIRLGGTPKRVHEIVLEGRNLSGRIPSEIGSLSGLKVFSLRGNGSMQGTIPPELGALSELQTLDLHGNFLEGQIPVSLTKLFKLKVLDLHANELEGTIPPAMGEMFNLERLIISGNSLTGTIPPELSNLSNLQDLALSQNQLTGTIPWELGNLQRLESLDLWENQLSGNLPSQLGQLRNLSSIIIRGNSFTGEIPPEFAGLTQLYLLDLAENQLSGRIPDWISGLSRLDTLSLRDNQFSGPIPTELGQLTNLQQLYLSMNNLTGTIPSSLGSLSELTNLNLRHNSLTGPIPPELGNLTKLESLLVGRNNLTGEIPSELGSLSRLDALYLGYGSLSGSIPASLGNLSNLRYLQLEHNNLTGGIPPELAQLSNLRSLWINNNMFSGIVPSELSNLSQLRELDITSSGLTGCLPFLLAHDPDLDITHDGLPACSRPVLVLPEGSTISLPISALLYNTLLQGSAISGTTFSNVLNGSVSANQQELVFTHDGSETTTAGFTYVVTAGNRSITGDLVIDVTPVNDPPTAVPDTFAMNEGQTGSIASSTLLSNDVDPDSRNIHVSAVSNAVNGRVSLEDGIVIYEHDGSETTAGRFTYTVSDGIESDSAVVEIEVFPVNDPPIAVTDADRVVEGEMVSLPASTLIRNDVDPENDDLRITSVGEAVNGTVWLEGPTVIYRHDGSETTMGGFTYTVSDGIASDGARVALSVIPSNDPPTGVMDALAIEEGGSITVPAARLLNNDTDPEGDRLTVKSVERAINGTVRVQGTSITYEHDGSETTTGGFTYTLTDGELTAMADVAVSVAPVNDAPVAGGDSLTVDEGGVLSVDAPALLANDTDAENDALTIVAVGDPVNGMVFLDGTTIIYEHDGSDTPTGSFSYTVSDGVAANSITVEITVTPIDDAPAATEGEDTGSSTTPTAGVPDSPTPSPDTETTVSATPSDTATPSTTQDAVSTPPAEDGGSSTVLLVVIIVVVAAISTIAIAILVRRRRST